MLHSSATLTADDVSIRCRIRRSPLASQPTFDEALEMTCTLRHWEVKKKDSLASALQGSMYSSSPLRASPAPMVSQRGGENATTSQERAVNHRLEEDDNQSILIPDDDCHEHGRHSEIGRNTIVDMRSMKDMNNGVDSTEVGGPELLLTALSDAYQSPPRNGRDDSPTQRRNLNSSGHRRVAPVQHPPSKKTKQPLQCRIPLTDIMVVDTYNVRFAATASIMHVTTLSSGLFEFDCFHCNGHDLLLAFLQASLPPERILDGGAPRQSLHQRPGQHPTRNSAQGRPLIRYCSSHSSIVDDVDALTERHLKTTMERETFSDKLSRRFRKVVVSLTEISAALVDSAVCCHQSSVLESAESSSMGGHARSHHGVMMRDGSETRDMPERAPDGRRTEASALEEAYAQLELAPDNASISNAHSPSPPPPHFADDAADTSTRTTTAADVTRTKMPKEAQVNLCKLHSGLSMEPDPDHHSTRSYSPQ